MGHLSDMRVAVIGGGKMGEAILGGWIASNVAVAQSLSGSNFVVSEPGVDRREFLKHCYSVSCVSDASGMDGSFDLVLLAVKPQVMMGVLESLTALPPFAGGSKGPLFVSIAAGLATDRLEKALPCGSRLVRVMPNMPLLVGAGASAVCVGSCATKQDETLVLDLFACLGEACVVEESDMDAVCALSGSGPAYVAALVESLRDAGVRQGLCTEVAEKLALQTIYGTACLMKETGQDPASTRLSICSPGGTTLAALDAMSEAGFDQVFDRGVSAAVQRSKELSSC